MPARSLASETFRGAALSVGALFVGCVIFYNVAGEAAWAAGLIFVMAFVPAVVAGALAGAVVYMLGRRRGGGDALAPGDAAADVSPTSPWRRTGLWLLGAVAGYAAINNGLGLLGFAERFAMIGMTMVVPAMIVGAAVAVRADALAGRQRVWALGVIGLVAATPFLMYAWWVVEWRRPLPPDVQRQWAADSADHELRLAQWVSDSAALDSVASTKDRSALVALLRSQESKPAEDALQAEACERARLSDLHGFEIAERMVHLANREVWPSKRAREDAQERLYGRVRQAFSISIGGEECGITSRQPRDTLSGLPVDRLGRRPSAPFRPRP